MAWIREHKQFMNVTGILLVLCLLVAFSYSREGRTTYLGKGIHKTTTVVTRPLSALSCGVGDFFTGVLSYKDIQAENDELRTRIEELESENMQLQLTAMEKTELAALYQAFSFEPYSETSKAVAGRVIETDLSNPYIVFTIDVGKESGVKEGCIVVDGNGLVGRVIETGNKWSKVSSVLSDANDISFHVLRDDSVTGVVYGDGADGMEGYVMDDTYRIIKGDTLITTGIGVYPAGIKIGTVETVDYDDDRQQRVITVKPTASFRGMQKVAVFL